MSAIVRKSDVLPVDLNGEEIEAGFRCVVSDIPLLGGGSFGENILTIVAAKDITPGMRLVKMVDNFPGSPGYGYQLQIYGRDLGFDRKPIGKPEWLSGWSGTSFPLSRAISRLNQQIEIPFYRDEPPVEREATAAELEG